MSVGRQSLTMLRFQRKAPGHLQIVDGSTLPLFCPFTEQDNIQSLSRQEIDNTPYLKEINTMQVSPATLAGKSARSS